MEYRILLCNKIYNLHKNQQNAFFRLSSLSLSSSIFSLLSRGQVVLKSMYRNTRLTSIHLPKPTWPLDSTWNYWDCWSYDIVVNRATGIIRQPYTSITDTSMLNIHWEGLANRVKYLSRRFGTEIWTFCLDQLMSHGYKNWFRMLCRVLNSISKTIFWLCKP